MPIFRFNVHDDRSGLDFDGAELDERQAVRDAAMSLVGDLLVDKAMRSATSGNWEPEVTNAEGLLVFRIGST